jgi:hypothetical protein
LPCRTQACRPMHRAMSATRNLCSRRAAAVAVVLATVLTVVGTGGTVGTRAEAAPPPRAGAACSGRQVGHQIVVGRDRVRCERDGRSIRWSLVPRPRIMLFGDSLAQESADYFGFFGGMGGADVQMAVHGGTAICDWFDEMVRAVHDFRPDAVVLAFTGNALTACMHDEAGVPLAGQALVDKYTHDVVAATWILSHSARSITWVGAPVGPTPNATTNALNALYASTPAWWSHVRYVDGGAYIAPNGVHATTLPCLFFEPCTGPVVDGVAHNTVRAPDGLHLCPTSADAVDGVVDACATYSSGALRYALTMLHPAKSDVGL